MNRAEVYAIIDGERAYQNKWDEQREAEGRPVRDRYVTVESWIFWMEDYLDRAKRAATLHTDRTEALAVVRKVTALGVACMEHLGAPAR